MVKESNNSKVILTAIAVFIVMLSISIFPSIYSAFAAPGNTTAFNVTATINSGSPSITSVESFSDSPNEGTTKTIVAYFNASHPNGVANIPASNAMVKINQSGVVLNSTACQVNATDSITVNKFACNITLNYYNLPGVWTINATIVDLAGNSLSNITAYYTNGNTYGISIKTTSIAFAGTPGSTVGATNNPQYVNNTGNVAYTEMNLTAYDLLAGSNRIAAQNFTANVTDGSGAGQTLINATPVRINASSLSVLGQRNLYLYLNIPAGASNGTYSSVSSWIVTLS
ncbi:MAG TPA: hypothetical protein VEC16_07130 [Alphaproteobacteria bacterium]|nr:hypothetical protein [Alphaproteobacteria bacterium]